jgi:hypothetical protein
MLTFFFFAHHRYVIGQPLWNLKISNSISKTTLVNQKPCFKRIFAKIVQMNSLRIWSLYTNFLVSVVTNGNVYIPCNHTRSSAYGICGVR